MKLLPITKKIFTNSSNEETVTGRNPGPFKARPIIAGPTSPGAPGSWELSISLTNTPGEINLNFLTDILDFSLLPKRYVLSLLISCTNSESPSFILYKIPDHLYVRVRLLK